MILLTQQSEKKINIMNSLSTVKRLSTLIGKGLEKFQADLSVLEGQQ
jgi:hypothetical protein